VLAIRGHPRACGGKPEMKSLDLLLRKTFLHDQAAGLLRADDAKRYILDAKRHEKKAKQLREAAAVLGKSKHGL